MADHSKPSITSGYINFVAELNGRLSDIMLGLDPSVSTPTVVPTNALRWNSATYRDEKWNGTSWLPKSNRYDININGTVGATTPSTGAFTSLSSSGLTTATGGLNVGTSSNKSPITVSTNITSNAGAYLKALYFNAGWKYSAATAGMGFILGSDSTGVYISTAPGSGTLDATATVTERLRINTSGLSVTGTQTTTRSGQGVVATFGGGTQSAYIYSGTGVSYFAAEPTVLNAVAVRASGEVGVYTTNILRGNFTSTGLSVTGALSATSAIHSTGGVGTGTNGVGLWFDTGTNTGYLRAYDLGVDWRNMIYNAKKHTWQIKDVDSLILDTSGNLGLGVTPSAWGNGQSMQGYAWVISSGSGFDNTILSTNARQTAYGGPTYSWVYRGSAAATSYAQTNGRHEWFTAPSGTAGNAINFTNLMTLDASGTLSFNNVSFGSNKAQTFFAGGYSSSPQYRLVMNHAGGGYWAIGTGNSSDTMIFGKASDIYGTISNTLMTLAASGNLGLGVTPSAWVSSAKAIQFTYPYFGMASEGGAVMGFNAYESSAGVWTYKTTDQASRFLAATDGSFSWYTAPSGTAGNPITFTQAMTLNASGLAVNGALSATGDLGIGTASPATRLHVQQPTLSGQGQVREVFIRADSDGTTNSYNSLVGCTFSARWVGAGYTAGSLDRSSGVYGINLDNGAFGRSMGLVFYTSALDANATERARIDASGNFGLGVTPLAWHPSQKTFQYSSLGAIRDGGGSAQSVYGAYFDTGGTWRYSASAAAATIFQQGGGTSIWYTAPSGTAGNPITFTQAMTLDSSGNLGLGVTPSAWGAASKVIQLGATSALRDFSGQSSYFNNTVVIGGTTPTYQTTAAASSYSQIAGHHIWFTAPSGTAGTAITFEQALTIDTSKNLLTAGEFYLQLATKSIRFSGISGTQTTSKSTNVSINATAGRITTHNASLAAGATVYFNVITSVGTIYAWDVVSVSLGDVTASSYQVWVSRVFDGGFQVALKNNTGGALSENVKINYVCLRTA